MFVKKTQGADDNCWLHPFALSALLSVLGYTLAQNYFSAPLCSDNQLQLSYNYLQISFVKLQNEKT